MLPVEVPRNVILSGKSFATVLAVFLVSVDV
jgi:hypothetical protein